MPTEEPPPNCTGTHLQSITFNITQERVPPRSHLDPSCTSVYGGTPTKLYLAFTLTAYLFNNIVQERVQPRSHLDPSCTSAYGGTPTQLYGGHSHLQPTLFNNIFQERVHPRSHLGPSCTSAYGGTPTKLYVALTYSLSFLIISLKNEHILCRTETAS